MPTPKQLYRHFIRDHALSHCWACGRTRWQVPDRWFAEWFIDRAHVVNKPRIEDVRAIVLLCRLCHARSSGARIVACHGHHWPKLTVANLVWLKKHRDPENFDRAFLQRYSVARLPRAITPPACYLDEYQLRHPLERILA